MAYSTTADNILVVADQVNTKNELAEIEAIEEAMPVKYWPSYVSQKFIVVWLDANINETSSEYQSLVDRLRCITTAIHLFTEVDPCIDFITNIEDGRFSFILSSDVSETILPAVYDLHQIESIYIVQNGEHDCQLPLSKWRKIKGSFVEFSLLIDSIQQNFRKSDQNMIATSIFSIDSTHDLDKLNPSFMYSKLLKEILLEMNYDERAKTNFFKFYREQHSKFHGDVSAVNNMEKNYDNRSPISWYKEQSDIFSLLNEALRNQDISSIIRMGVYLKDLHQNIERIYLTVDKNEKLLAYRGQYVSNVEFDQIRTNIGGLLSFNNFLSTTLDRQIALMYTDRSRSPANCTSILFDIEIDPTTSKAPFAPLKLIKYLPRHENEILFSMHTVYRICSVAEISDHVWNIKIALTSDTDTQLERLSNRIREEIQAPNVLHRLGNLLVKMGQFDKAKEIYSALLDLLSSDNTDEVIYVYNQIGNVLMEQGQLENARWILENTIKIVEQSTEANVLDVSTTYNYIGLVYSKLGNYSKALTYYEKSLNITDSIPPSDHPELAATYNNIGLLYNRTGEYAKALTYYKMSIEIKSKTLPSNHPELAIAYNNIGSVYANLGDYATALQFYERMLEIAQKTLPSDHPLLASNYNSIASMHQVMGDYSTALCYLEKTLQIQQKTLSENHPDLAVTFHSIGWAYYSIGEYDKALACLEKSLQIRQISLPDDHPHLASVYNILGLIYRSIEDYTKALEHLENTLKIYEKAFSSNHPSYAEACNNIGSTYEAMGEYPKALAYYEKTLNIREKILPPNHPDIAVTYNNVGLVYNSMGDYEKALPYYEKTLQIQNKSLPPNHPGLAQTYNNIGLVNSEMNEHLNAISYYKKALKIQQVTYPSNHPTLIVTYKNIGRAHMSRGHFGYALQYYTDALKIQEKLQSNNRASLVDEYKNVGEMYLRTGNCFTARENYEKALAIQIDILPGRDPSLAKTYVELSEVCRRMRTFEKAKEYIRKAIEIQSDSSPKTSSSLATSYYSLAQISKDLRQYSDALLFVTKAIGFVRSNEAADLDQLKQYEKFKATILNMHGNLSVEESDDEKREYPVYLVSPRTQETELDSSLESITNYLSIAPIAINDCIHTLQSNSKPVYLIIDVQTMDTENRDSLLKAVIDLPNIESIYLFGKPPQTRQSRNEFFQKYNNISFFSDDQDQLIVQCSLDMASYYRSFGNEYKSKGEDTTAHKYFFKSASFYDKLAEFIRTKKQKQS